MSSGALAAQCRTRLNFVRGGMERGGMGRGGMERGGMGRVGMDVVGREGVGVQGRGNDSDDAPRKSRFGEDG